MSIPTTPHHSNPHHSTPHHSTPLPTTLHQISFLPGPSDAPGPEEIVIRTVSNIEVPHTLPSRLSARTFYPKAMKYQSKAIMMFQRDTSDIDQALFAMYVQEYDEHSDGSNKRMAYIAYLDSVSYMRPSEYIVLHRVTSCYILLHLVTSCYIVLHLFTTTCAACATCVLRTVLLKVDLD